MTDATYRDPPPASTSGMHDMTYGDKRTPQEIHDHGDCKGFPCCAACRREQSRCPPPVPLVKGGS